MTTLPLNGEQMPVSITEQELVIPAPRQNQNGLEHIAQSVDRHLADDEVPIRFVVTASNKGKYRCEVGKLSGVSHLPESSIFSFNRRRVESANTFNAVLLVPTGIGAEIGGHAGDATPVATLLASVCDTLVTHPNVVNAYHRYASQRLVR